MKGQINKALDAMKHSEVRNYVLPGVSSFLIGGDSTSNPRNGLVRMFVSERETEEHVVPHSHRFNFTAIVTKGWVENIIYTPDSSGAYEYVVGHQARESKTFGDYKIWWDTLPLKYTKTCTRYGVVNGYGQDYRMEAEQIHTIRFGAGAKLLVLEEPTRLSVTKILAPWAYGRRVPTMQVPDWMFEHV